MSRRAATDPTDRSSLPWLALGLTVVLLTGLMVVGVRDWSYRPAGALATYVPADGARTSDGVDGGRVWENATAAGDPGLGLVPGALARQLRELQQEGPGPLQLWWRSTMISGPDADSSRLLVLRGNALWLQTDYDQRTSRAYAPALPLHPAAASVGDRWTQTGQVVDGAGSRRPYELTGRLLATTDSAYAGSDCLSVELTVAVEADPAVSRRYVLCRGVGLVDMLDAGQTRSSIPGYHRPAVAPAAGARPATPPATWTASRFATTQPLSARDVAETAGDRLIGSAGGETDLLGWRRNVSATGQRWDVGWVRRPGGRILTIAASGRTVLVTTDRRIVVAYDESGRWLWTQPLTGLSRAGIVSVSADRFAVALLDGTVQLRRNVDGAVVASDQLPGAVLARLVASPTGDLHYVADDAGTLRAYDTTGARRWEQSIIGGRVVLHATADGVLVRTGAEVAHLVAGAPQWQVTIGSGVLDVLDDRVLVARNDGLEALDLNTGRLVWRHGAAVDLGATRVPLTVAGHVAVLAEKGRLVAIDRDGVEVAALAATDTLGVDLVAVGAGVTAWSGTRGDVTFWGSGG